MLNEGQREAVEKAVIENNKLLLIQGPPGIRDSCVSTVPFYLFPVLQCFIKLCIVIFVIVVLYLTGKQLQVFW